MEEAVAMAGIFIDAGPVGVIKDSAPAEITRSKRHETAVRYLVGRLC